MHVSQLTLNFGRATIQIQFLAGAVHQSIIQTHVKYSEACDNQLFPCGCNAADEVHDLGVV